MVFYISYYLLLILNLSTPKIEIKKRLKMILFLFGIFLTVNIIRIVLLSLLFIKSPYAFDFTHWVTWYIMSVAFVIVIWFGSVKLFKIKEITVYSDLKTLYKKIK